MTDVSPMIKSQVGDIQISLTVRKFAMWMTTCVENVFPEKDASLARTKTVTNVGNYEVFT